ncbi:30S ribosomal protein S12 methylthiotransferase RimO [Devriesea agamarum]|uniref:30S ribosomal protein S12 methylthiotransferase RimO n=1 Tax=Devriesea agamarum TaxID=472569 RepID=UPI000A01138C|nr:30S ribosomal protein S12 methylthiotransferase RimO [Devriesea agamarum]
MPPNQLAEPNVSASVLPDKSVRQGVQQASHDSSPLISDATDRTVALVTLGCVRNEVDSEELAGRLAAGGWRLVDDASDADVAVVNTCGFVEAAKKDSIDALLEAADLKTDQTARTQAVVAVGCMAERYGQQLADSLPEADAVLGFDSYTSLAQSLTGILAGQRPASHLPVDRRTMLPVSPVRRRAVVEAGDLAVPGHMPVGEGGYGGAPRTVRQRLNARPWAPLKIASGCDRRCAFCAIPSFRGAFISRTPEDILQEARWLADQGVREAFLVSENSTSYGKDFGDIQGLDRLLPQLADIPGLERIRVSYLQPAEVRPGLLEAMTQTPKVAPYFDLSFQHASAPLLRRMRRFGSREQFLDLIGRIRAASPHAGLRTNVIVGFPGETQADLDELERFLAQARLDVVGVFGYSDEEGTEAAQLDGALSPEEIEARRAHIDQLVEELTEQRAWDRVGEEHPLLVEEVAEQDTGDVSADSVAGGDAQLMSVGRIGPQGPEVDGTTSVIGELPIGRFVPVRIVGAEGVDLHAEVIA